MINYKGIPIRLLVGLSEDIRARRQRDSIFKWMKEEYCQPITLYLWQNHPSEIKRFEDFSRHTQAVEVHHH